MTLTFLALLFSGLTPLTASAKQVVGNELKSAEEDGFGFDKIRVSQLVLVAIKRLYSAIQLGLILCCAFALHIVVANTLPFIDFKFDLLVLVGIDFPFLVEVTGIMMLIWLAWLFHVSSVISTILSYRKKTIFKNI